MPIKADEEDRTVGEEPHKLGYPSVVQFEQLGPCYYSLGAYACPKKGEWFLSGGTAEAWRALDDLDCPYRIVRPTFHALNTTVYVMGQPVVIPDEEGA